MPCRAETNGWGRTTSQSSRRPMRTGERMKAWRADAPASGSSTTTTSDRTGDHSTRGTGRPERARRHATIRAIMVSAGRGDAESLVGTTIAGKYFVHQLLGRGGMGDVYKATLLGPDRPVALKLLSKGSSDPTLPRRFEREVAAASRLRHPNAIEVVDFGETSDGSPYLAMEFVPGHTLAQVISAEAPLPPARAVHLLAQVLAALADAHANGVIHRDLKPANVMIDPLRDAAGFVKVLDFGIATLGERSQRADAHGHRGEAPDRPGAAPLGAAPRGGGPSGARGAPRADAREAARAAAGVRRGDARRPRRVARRLARTPPRPRAAPDGRVPAGGRTRAPAAVLRRPSRARSRRRRRGRHRGTAPHDPSRG